MLNKKIFNTARLPRVIGTRYARAFWRRGSKYGVKEKGALIPRG